MQTTPSSSPSAEDTRDRILYAAAELFRRQGYSATGMKQIATAADAPFGSIYHFFKGGKQELAEAVIRTAGPFFATLIDHLVDPAPDLAAGITDLFDGAAETVRVTDYEDACPIAAIALEVAGTDPGLRAATSDVFAGWIEALAVRLRRAGVPEAEAGEVATLALAALEGAFLLARAGRDERAIEVAGAYVSAIVADAVDRSRSADVA